MFILVGVDLSPATGRAALPAVGLVATDTCRLAINGAVGLPEGSSGVADHRGVADFMDSPHV